MLGEARTCLAKHVRVWRSTLNVETLNLSPTKRFCQGCGAKFYDLQRDPIVCPSCGTTFDPDVATRGKRSRAASAAVKPAKPAPEKVSEPEKEVDEDFDDEVAEDVAGDDDDALLVTDDDLDGGDEDIPGINVSEDEEES